MSGDLAAHLRTMLRSGRRCAGALVLLGSVLVACAGLQQPPLEPGVGSFDDGTYHVGTDIQPGTYRTREPASSCYWERVSGFSGDWTEIIENYRGFGWAETGEGYAIASIAESDAGFSSTGCGRWTSDLSAVVDPNGPIGESGAFIVGTDMTPGIWRSTGDVHRVIAGDSCFVVRLSGFGGSQGEIIRAEASALGGLAITIEMSDRGFETVGCGTWRRVEGSVAEEPRSLVESQLRRSRQPILDALADLGYECGSEGVSEPGQEPGVICTFPGGLADERVVMFAAADDFRGVGLITYDIERVSDFLLALGSPRISELLVDAIEETIRLGHERGSPCSLPCDIGPLQGGGALGNIEARIAVGDDLLIVAVLQEIGF